MFVTSPCSTPRRKRKVTKQVMKFIDVEKKGNTLGKVAMDEFQGRSDFCGHEEANDEERKLVTNFLARKELEYVDLPWHWFLFVYKRDEGIFKLWNSMHDPFAVGKAEVYTKFLAGSIRHLWGFDLVSEPVLREPCRQQGATLDCGVYACMWLECLARDTYEIWSYAQDVKMDTYRARLAATILSYENGLLKNKFE
ncbi:uncharacterized protein LOC142537553 [Primulina tabacum]|uniref:uncharacterized protein LOC142537553 n=1 Tax=Primulina tabacum TaxID=48773 RepID=UPI003F59DF5C